MKVTHRKLEYYYYYYYIQVWDGCSSGCISFNSQDVNEEHIAYMIGNSVIVESCTELAHEQNDVVDIRYGTKINDVKFSTSSVS